MQRRRGIDRFKKFYSEWGRMTREKYSSRVKDELNYLSFPGQNSIALSLPGQNSAFLSFPGHIDALRLDAKNNNVAVINIENFIGYSYF